MLPKRCSICTSNVINDGVVISVQDKTHDDIPSDVYCHSMCSKSMRSYIKLHQLKILGIKSVKYDYVHKKYMNENQ